MESRVLNARLRLWIELALDRDCSCQETRAGQERRADELGLTGAEVDAARQSHSFDIRVAAAIDVACALGTGEPVRIHAAASRALLLGYTMTELQDVAKLVKARGTSPPA